MFKKLLITITIALSFQICFGQDTLTVQTLDFNDITKRRGWYVFPSDTNSWQKILMYYTLKCDQATTQDQYACGEWDYTTYTNLYQHKNTGTDYYQINGAAPDTINTYNLPTYSYYRNYQYFPVYTSTTENTYTVGSGSISINHMLQSIKKTGKAQYLWRANELTSAGLIAGSIDKLEVDIATLGSELQHLNINIKHTSLNELSDTLFEQGGFTNVYHFNTTPQTTGLNTLDFATPFIWDGVSNIVVEFSYNNYTNGNSNIQLVGSTTSYNSGVYSNNDDGILNFSWGEYVDVPNQSMAPIDSFITISFWHYGDTSKMPQNSYVFEARDTNDNRVVNIHLPWSNSSVYWDCGNSSTGSYDRINKGANFNDFAGQWNHWAFTKNVATGEMKVYLNGKLWHSGAGLSRTIDNISSIRIAGPANNYGRYDGSLNEFRLFNAALDSTTIKEWMHKDLNSSHPYYNKLQAYYKFDDLNGTIASDSSGNGHNATLMGLPDWNLNKGEEINRLFTTTNQRPNIGFVQGNYTMHLDSVMVLDSVMNAPVSIVHSNPVINFNNSGITYNIIDTIVEWESGWMYTYNKQGDKVDSTFVAHNSQYINQYKQTTYQLQNYVTPYGIGLSLGPNGFRWVYDVTDYMPLFNDTLEISAGNQQELIDLKFVFIKGTPPRKPIEVNQIHLGDYQHKDIANDDVMKNVNINLNPLASQYRIKTRTTGHWFGGYQNCAEFCPKKHNVFINGVKEFEWTNWKECSDNPVIDQGGTWIYDRAGWCPGTFADTYDHELTPFVTPGGNVNIDYGMETTAGGMEGNYRTSVQLISYEAPNWTNDAELYEIKRPNNWEFYNLINPICTGPIVTIRNTGTATLTSLTITYQVVGGLAETYNWTGSLDFLETEDVELPISTQNFWLNGSPNKIFEAEVSVPNGATDEYSGNNKAETAFDTPPVYPSQFYIQFKTNNAAYENSYTIKDDAGNTVYSKSSLSANTTYRDTLTLADGCYVFELKDNGQDGLSFFANNDGNGYIYFRKIGAGIFQNFNPSFGNRIEQHFVVGYPAKTEELKDLRNFNISPNPSKGNFNIDFSGFADEHISIEVFNALGKQVYTTNYYVNNDDDRTQLNLRNLNNGIYFIRLTTNNTFMMKQIIKN